MMIVPPASQAVGGHVALRLHQRAGTEQIDDAVVPVRGRPIDARDVELFEQERAAGPQQSARVRHRHTGVGHVVQASRQQNGIELVRAALELEEATVPRIDPAPPRRRHRLGIRVDRHHLHVGCAQGGGDFTGPTSHVKHPRASLQILERERDRLGDPDLGVGARRGVCHSSLDLRPTADLANVGNHPSGEAASPWNAMGAAIRGDKRCAARREDNRAAGLTTPGTELPCERKRDRP